MMDEVVSRSYLAWLLKETTESPLSPPPKTSSEEELRLALTSGYLSVRAKKCIVRALRRLGTWDLSLLGLSPESTGMVPVGWVNGCGPQTIRSIRQWAADRDYYIHPLHFVK